MNWRLPKEVYLGYGVYIKVVELPRGDIQAIAGKETDAFWQETFESDDKYYGRVYLDKAMARDRKRAVFYHEITHAVIDLWECAISWPI